MLEPQADTAEVPQLHIETSVVQLESDPALRAPATDPSTANESGRSVVAESSRFFLVFAIFFICAGHQQPMCRSVRARLLGAPVW